MQGVAVAKKEVRRWTLILMKLPKLVLMLFAPIMLMAGFTFAPLMQGLGGTQQPTDQQALVAERLQAEVEGYQEVLKREPENVNALRGLVDLQLQLQQPAEAIAPLAKLVELEPDNLSLGIMLGRLKVEAGDSQGAIAQFQAMHSKHPKDDEILKELVNAEVDAGNTKQAISLMQKRLKETPDSLDLQLQMATVYTRADQQSEAIKIYDKLIGQDPSDFRPVLGKAIALSADQADEATRKDAKSLFNKAVSLASPQQRPQIERIANFYAQLNTSNNLVFDNNKVVIPDQTPPPSPGSK
jgi:predicted Zn-dependent protease